MSSLSEKIRNNFENKEYRKSYADDFLNSSIATQIKVLREQRGWTQNDLATRADMKQSRISSLEDVNYSSWSLTTLRRLAEAFDLRLKVTFEEFGTLLHDLRAFSPVSLQRKSFESDPIFAPAPIEVSEKLRRMAAGTESPSSRLSSAFRSCCSEPTLSNPTPIPLMPSSSSFGEAAVAAAAGRGEQR